MADSPFHGAKLMLTCGDRLLTCLRDDVPRIPFPGHWDLPGGGREGDEAPLACALRELHEEFGLRLPPSRLTGHRFPSQQRPGMMSWLFAGLLRQDEIAAIRFGDEGQGWCMMPVAEFVVHPRAVPHFRDWVRALSAASAPCPAPADAARRP
ncbi:NUDIX hydrolase [Paracoccus spongiarum]|uniref:NUDIX hydrolase n=1 Tax=Paracoccus spongiarum TaxID=3064387 RepID=A0ABT9JE28_9RHOB|nr:NUDIX hydrolase [Paracoccus sp. 2205BS29-5]MDP5307352.1 NUDIX hydrolase [Paracoccus sp. 2205BS29-5]